MKLVIRRYAKSDAPTLAKLFYGTADTASKNGGEPDTVKAENYDLSEWERSFCGRYTTVAELDGETVGFGDIEVSVMCSMCAASTVGRLFVHKDCRRRGVGRAVLRALEDHAAKNAARSVSAFAPASAKPFFEAAGYSTVSEDSFEYRGAEASNYLMEKFL